MDPVLFAEPVYLIVLVLPGSGREAGSDADIKGASRCIGEDVDTGNALSLQLAVLSP